MKIDGLLYTLPKELKFLIASFCVVLSVGFYTGLFFVGETSSNSVTGIEENYLGNENHEEAKVMKFKKSNREMLSIVHSHILSMSLIFFLLGLILSLAKLPQRLKLFLIIEPFFSVLLTFGGIYFLWKEVLWMKYVVAFSGTLMTLTFTASVLIVLSQLFLRNK